MARTASAVRTSITLTAILEISNIEYIAYVKRKRAAKVLTTPRRP
jgi:hypothetical protein